MHRVPSIAEKAEVEKLPHWARVALAARCAKRLQPVLGRTWTDSSKEDIETIDNAITLVETAAKNAESIKNFQNLMDDILCVLKNFKSYVRTQKVQTEKHPAYYCIHVVYCALRSVHERSVGDRAWEACDCCEKIGDLCYGPSYRDNLLRHISWDIEKLKTQSSWRDSTPVPQESLGTCK